MPFPSAIIGIDIGSVTISAVKVNPQKEINQSAYEFHKGKIPETLKSILNSLGIPETNGSPNKDNKFAIAVTSSTPSLIRNNGQYDSRVSIIRAVHHFYSKAGLILFVGGEKFGLILLDEQGNYLKFKANTSCAAGTGSFLDQQARRLNLDRIQSLGEMAFNNKGALPKIASRCSVFAKTDLIHAQQEGYSPEEICDGLCFGLAKNITDTLFTGDNSHGPLIFAGGVSKNRSVAKHLNSITKKDILVHDHSHLFGAFGAALNLLDNMPINDDLNLNSIDRIIISEKHTKKYFHSPLELKLSDYPDFKDSDQYLFLSENKNSSVEVDLYEELKPGPASLYLGVDIGSTSTKAVLMDKTKRVIAGFYTRTAGRPLGALQFVLAAIDDLQQKTETKLTIIGAGTTGSGRKFVGNVIGADLIVDEITAHAEAACMINPEVDTIIEIGGQDSKFTTLKNGSVTFSIMNTVCAAGTGSFIEEQAEKLGCPLEEYSSRTEHKPAPIASDRCTVFMERDINHYLSEGFSIDEALTAVLHAIRENYLTKTAIEGNIGKTVLFQGATAKNRALVAAFEQRLDKPIHVSRYCHLTGALGVALMLHEQDISETTFRGIDLHKKDIPIKSEICDICTNHCKLTLADIDGDRVAFGFLCGRDYESKKYVKNNSSGYDLIKERKKIRARLPKTKITNRPVVGIPAALHVYEDMDLWLHFFNTLGIKAVTSEGFHDALKVGKHIAGAELCAPMAAYYGHVSYLSEKCDYIFLPFYLEKKSKLKGIRRQFCYYTQYASSLASSFKHENRSPKYLMPLIHYLYNSFHTRVQLYRMVKTITNNSANNPIGFAAVLSAYEKALEFKDTTIDELKTRFIELSVNNEDINVVLLGRPYSILSTSMNKGIPDIFESLGIRTFFQDMLPYNKEHVRTIDPLLNELHWHYAAKIMESAEIVAQTRGSYPVLITSFKCTPDSFVIDYFKKVMDTYNKPYLILQLDEHGSRGGYETRVEAAIRSFRNHYLQAQPKIGKSISPSFINTNKEKSLSGKTLLIPNWDNLPLQLITTALQREGIDARLLEENQTSIRKSLRHNTGQCIPLNIIAQEYMDYIQHHDLDPSKTALWIGEAWLACNIHLFPLQIKSILEDYGRNSGNDKYMSTASVYVGSFSFQDLSIRMPFQVYFAYMFGGYIRRIGCRLRPYEKVKGSVDKAIFKSINILQKTFRGECSRTEALIEALECFDDIRVSDERRPKVAIFGDLYARDNNVINQDLVPFIEENGGEVITTPYSAYLKMIAKPYLRKWLIEGHYISALSSGAFLAGLRMQEKSYYKYFEKYLGEPEPEYNDSPKKILSEYNIRIEHTGESMENIIKIHYLTKYHPDISLFIQTNPAFCCPSLVTEAMADKIEEKTGIPIVPITYDGTGGNKNDIIIPYLKYPRINRTKEKGERHREFGA